VAATLLLRVSAHAQGPVFEPPTIVNGGLVVPLDPPGSPFLNAARLGEPEQNNMAKGVPGRIQSIVNIHNPSIEFHPADPGINTGAAMIVRGAEARRNQVSFAPHCRRVTAMFCGADC